MSSSQPVPLNGAAASDCESLESYGSSSYASGAGGAGDATPSKRMSSRKRKDVNYKERKERKLPTVVASPVAGLGQEEEVTSSVTLNEEPTTSKSHGEINSSKAFPSDTKRYILKQRHLPPLVEEDNL
ncbi:uncharacterized protein LOC142357955 [Convolutriloba macropyga]|uniref:uncharacterized protein LOC142357955 n=1 Tax=Convolutriloba macropyga TaxID=536237 RepID=UPI003F51D520